jgi:hypothetical protein
VGIKKLITVAGLALLTVSAAGIAGCGSSGSAQAARCGRAVARAASSSSKQPASVRYALILQACTTKAMLDSAVQRWVGQGQLSATVGQISIVCDEIKPAPKVCAQLGRHG